MGTAVGEMNSETQMEAKAILIAANPHSGAMDRRPLLETLAERLRSEGYEPHLCYEMQRWGLLASELQVQGRLKLVVSAGGDGTLAAVVNQIAPEVPILVVPLGTENLLAKHFGLTANVEDILALIRNGTEVRIDAGKANGRLFLVMFSCGFDAAVVSRMHQERKGHISRWSWAKPIWQTIQSYRYPKVTVQSDVWRGLPTPKKVREEKIREELQNGVPEQAAPVEFEARWVFVFNVPRYAGGLHIADHAVDDDGLLDVCTFRGGSLWLGLMYLWAIFTRSHKRHSDCRIGKCAGLRLESRQEVPYQLDGDYGGVLPVEIEVIPNRVTLWIAARRR